MLLVLAPLASLSLAGQEHGRTIPLAVIVQFSPLFRLCRTKERCDILAYPEARGISAD